MPGASARWGSYLAPGVILMPSYVNIGARVGADTMVDTWATVGSCAQIGEQRAPLRWRRHRWRARAAAGRAGHRGQRRDDRLAVHGDAGARVGDGSVLGEGVILNPGIPVIDAETGEEVSRGVVPPWCIVVQAGRARSFPGGDFASAVRALIIRRLSEGERHDKAKLNDILRDHGVAT